jgi:hypothetical protein
LLYDLFIDETMKRICLVRGGWPDGTRRAAEARRRMEWEMDEQRFDDALRTFGQASNRRRAVAGVLAALFGAPLAAAAKASHRHRATSHEHGHSAHPRGGPAKAGPCGNGLRKDNICTSDTDCCTGICDTKAGKKNIDGKGRCRCQRRGKPCTSDKNCCNFRSCSNGFCGGGCSSATCPNGCCEAGVCMPGTANSACGTGGAVCLACTSPDTCQAGVCTPPATCDGISCAAGCCDGSTCVPYASQSTSQCGAAGAACAACTVSNTCQTGVCTPPPCDGSTCAAGCCDGSTCVPYASQNNLKCGTAGNACGFCTAPQTCTSVGTCVF